MKKIMSGLLLMFSAMTVSSFANNDPLIYEETLTNKNGYLLIRIHNDNDYAVGCGLQDNDSFSTFVVYPGEMSLWYPVQDDYIWFCE